MKLWQKTGTALKEVERFTVGNDTNFDYMLASYDVLGSIAHTMMLSEVGLITKEELSLLKGELQTIYSDIQLGNFVIEQGVEDVHSQVELILTQRLGDVGKKVHSARSRNDQVLVDLKLYLRSELHEVVDDIKDLFALLISQSEKYKNYLMPGYTHMQLAMPSSFGLWFAAYAEALSEDVHSILSAYKIVNKNPLGSAAGYGSSFDIDRMRTTELLGFDHMHVNVINAQMSRGKTERMVAQSMANVADTLSKLSMDACLYLNQNFGFISFPIELTTGSSIMPHKKNPDVFELVRSHCNRIKALPNEISLMTTNLPSGYHRDFQLLKENLFPALSQIKDCIKMTMLMLSNIEINSYLLEDPKYKYIFSVEEVNKLVRNGTPFRDAYREIGSAIEEGNYTYDTRVNHTHQGSIGNLCNEMIEAQMEEVLIQFRFEKYEKKCQALLMNP